MERKSEDVSDAVRAGSTRPDSSLSRTRYTFTEQRLGSADSCRRPKPGAWLRVVCICATELFQHLGAGALTVRRRGVRLALHKRVWGCSRRCRGSTGIAVGTTLRSRPVLRRLAGALWSGSKPRGHSLMASSSPLRRGGPRKAGPGTWVTTHAPLAFKQRLLAAREGSPGIPDAFCMGQPAHAAGDSRRITLTTVAEPPLRHHLMAGRTISSHVQPTGV